MAKKTPAPKAVKKRSPAKKAAPAKPVARTAPKSQFVVDLARGELVQLSNGAGPTKQQRLFSDFAEARSTTIDALIELIDDAELRLTCLKRAESLTHYRQLLQELR